MSRIIRSPEKQIQYRKKRRILSVVFLLCLGAFLWLVVYIPSIPSLQVKSIIVEGNKVLTKEEVGEKTDAVLSGKYFYAFPKRNMFLYPKKEAEGVLRASFPRIESVSTDIGNDRVLTVSVSEREPFALWCGREILPEKADDACSYIDRGGFVFAKAPHFSGNAYFEFYGKGALPDGNPVGNYFLSPVPYRNILKIKEHLESFGLKPATIFVAEDGHAEFSESSGYKVRFNTDQDAVSLESNMQAVFHSTAWGDPKTISALEYLDFRFGNKVYYKYKNQE